MRRMFLFGWVVVAVVFCVLYLHERNREKREEQRVEDVRKESHASIPIEYLEAYHWKQHLLAAKIITPAGTFSGAATRTEGRPIWSVQANHIINISSRAQVGPGDNVLVAGFAVGGTQAETVLLRAVGPGLETSFGASGVLTKPKLVLYDKDGMQIAANFRWGIDPTPGASPVQTTVRSADVRTMTSVGAFPLAPDSSDSAMVVTLPPGNYTAQVTGNGGSTGIALLEVYEVR